VIAEEDGTVSTFSFAETSRRADNIAS